MEDLDFNLHLLIIILFSKKESKRIRLQNK